MSSALALFSGGLDSLLAARVIMEQGVKVTALQFITPFFNYKHKGREELSAVEFKEKYGFDCIIEDVSEGFIKMVRNPVHGYGKNFNPCLDCKIFMMSRARSIMEERGFDFIVSGEVLGQRPMSQRRDAMRIVERDSGLDGYLLRPLCAKLLKPTHPELKGLVDRDKLLDISGRGRKRQIELAAAYGIEDYQTPAGGCQLTDPTLSKRYEKLLRENERVEVEDVRLLAVGRHFDLPGGKLFIGRNKEENRRIAALTKIGDYTLKVAERPGPLALLRGVPEDDDLMLSARITARYADTEGLESVNVTFATNGWEDTINASPLDEETLDRLRASY